MRGFYGCGTVYKKGLLFCDVSAGLCSYHELGTATGWNQPPELQPGFATGNSECTVWRNGSMMITGGIDGESPLK